MRKLSYEKLMAHNPTKIGSVYNQNHERVSLYEHPMQGDLAPIIAVFDKAKQAFETDFFDTEDFYQGSDYNPILLEDGTAVCAFEIRD